MGENHKLSQVKAPSYSPFTALSTGGGPRTAPPREPPQNWLLENTLFRAKKFSVRSLCQLSSIPERERERERESGPGLNFFLFKLEILYQILGSYANIFVH